MKVEGGNKKNLLMTDYFWEELRNGSNPPHQDKILDKMVMHSHRITHVSLNLNLHNTIYNNEKHNPSFYFLMEDKISQRQTCPINTFYSDRCSSVLPWIWHAKFTRKHQQSGILTTGYVGEE